ncbi:hypothetical protein [Nodularia chucula]|uniref:hypothetical protein n=1 Tax=Nodularia chucula TaxID=3093667 RepID=UPI0039C6606E
MFKVSKDYIGTIGNLGFYIPEIKEVKFYLSSEDNAFQLEPKLEFNKKWNENWRQLGSNTVYIQYVDNPHLFFEVLEMLKVPVNFDALPELANIY